MITQIDSYPVQVAIFKANLKQRFATSYELKD